MHVASVVVVVVVPVGVHQVEVVVVGRRHQGVVVVGRQGGVLLGHIPDLDFHIPSRTFALSHSPLGKWQASDDSSAEINRKS